MRRVAAVDLYGPMLQGERVAQGHAGSVRGAKLEPWVLEVLRCPRCGSRLAIETKLLCSRCGSAYPLADGIPILLDE